MYGRNGEQGGGVSEGKIGDISNIKEIREQLLHAANEKVCCIRHLMLCYVVLFHVMLCYVMICYVMLCYVILCNVM